jgi:hypothetical protein
MENWNATKEALLEGLEGSKKKIVSTLLENQRQYLQESTGGTSTDAGAVSNFQKIVIPMIRRILPGTIATDLVGVQPMSGPVGLVYSFCKQLEDEAFLFNFKCWYSWLSTCSNW